MTRLFTILALAACLAAPAALADTPFLGFDIDHAQGTNDYFFNFYSDQVLGVVFTVTVSTALQVDQLGAFDMNPDNEPYSDPENPALAEHGFQHDHGVAIFTYPSMEKLGEVIIPAGTSAPIMDEGYRYMSLDSPITLEPGNSYAVAAWWATGSITDGGMDTFYLMSDTPGVIPSTITIHPDVEIIDGCFNPSPTNGPSVDAPFIFNMYWGLYAGGANFRIVEPVSVERKSWSAVKRLF